MLMLTGAGLAIASRVLGVRMLVENSDSMYPAISTGDLVLSRDVAAEHARVGDVVTFPDPARGGQSITHRVTAIRRSGDILVFTTRGDANPGAEQWTVVTGTTIGRTVRIVPDLGRILEPLRRPPIAAALNGVLVTLLVLLAVRRRRSPGVPAPR
ncbi:MAG TPA: signal peptidase I [Actinoplanes sp.]|nr:signal peptidase I [Actinoplanes sp.]